MKIAAGDLRVDFAIERIERDVERLHAGLSNRRSHGLAGIEFARQ